MARISAAWKPLRIMWFISGTVLLSFVIGQNDVTLTCPTKWCSRQRVTLYCAVAKSSLSKCNTQANITNFRRKTTGSYVTNCPVDNADYATCNYSTGIPSTFDCGCQQNATHYIFVYEINATSTAHDGSWECEKACFDAGGFKNPLNATVSPNCQNVKVIDCDLPPENEYQTDSTKNEKSPGPIYTTSNGRNYETSGETSEPGIGTAITVGVVLAVMTIAIIIAYKLTRAVPPPAQEASNPLITQPAAVSGKSGGAGASLTL